MRAAESERERVRQAIEEDIVFGRLKPRERLIEQELMERLSARRHVVRAAFDSLESKGMIVRQANKGALVNDVSVEDINELYFMRELLHRAAAEVTPLPLEQVVFERLNEIQTQHEVAIAAEDYFQAYRLNDLFHSLLNKACANRLLEEALNNYNQRSHLIRSIAFSSKESLLRSAKEHREIITALQNDDRNAFIQSVLLHVVRAKNAYLKSIT